MPTDAHCLKKINQILKNIKRWDETIGKEAQKGEGLLEAVANDFDTLTKEADVGSLTLFVINSNVVDYE